MQRDQPTDDNQPTDEKVAHSDKAPRQDYDTLDGLTENQTSRDADSSTLGRVEGLAENLSTLPAQRIAGDTNTTLAAGRTAVPATSGETAENTLDPATLPAAHDSLATLAPSAGSTAASNGQTHAKLRFRKLRQHAEGGLGRVSLAQDTELQREVAVKEIKESYADLPDSRARFVFEAEVTGRLEHPGIVPVYALGQHADGRPYYAMRFITGTAMDQAIRQLHQPAERTAYDRKLRDLLNRFVSVCDTMHYSHSRGYVHRDIKPANIMLGEYGETLVVDWGLAKQLAHTGSEPEAYDPGDTHTASGDATQIGSVVGTLRYMSPEQAAGDVHKINATSDVYSLGATLYHILTGHAPLSGKRKSSVHEILSSVRRGQIPAPSSIKADIPKPLEAICKAAMHVNPERRYQSARELAADVENYLADGPVSVLPETAFQIASRWMRKHRGITNAIGISLVVVAIVSGFAYAVTRRSLTKTQRLLAISKLELEYDHALADEKQRLTADGTPPESIPVAPALIDQSTHLVTAIEDLKRVDEPDFIDQIRRGGLLETWTDSLHNLLDRRMNRSMHDLLSRELERLEQEYPWPDAPELPRTLAELRRQIDQQIGKWYPIELPAWSALGFKAKGEQYIRAAEPDADSVVLVSDSEPGNQQLSVVYGNGWQTAQGLGIVLNQTEESAYRFVIAGENYDPRYGFERLPTLEEAVTDKRLALFITREDYAQGATILRRQPATTINAASEALPSLSARREGGTLLTLVFGSIEIEFEDAMPLSPKILGSVGLICPPGTSVTKLSMEGQRYDQTWEGASELELGDQGFAAGDFTEALRHYEKLPNSIEALFKRALIYEREQPLRYVDMLKEIVNQHSIEGVTDARERQAYLNAGVRLILHHQTQTDGLVLATNVVNRLKTNFDLDDVQRLIPESERTTFNDLLLKPGKRSRMVFDNREEIEYLQEVIDTYADIFSNNALWRRLAYWRLADACQAQWDEDPAQARGEARAILVDLLAEVDALSAQELPVEEIERTTLVRDLVWLDLMDRREPDALTLVNRYLPQDLNQMPPGRLPMLIDRARITHAQGDLAAAKGDLDFFLEHVDPKRPPRGVHFTHFGEACGIRGIIHEAEGELEKAQAVWFKGRRRNWIEWFPDPVRTAKFRGWDMILDSETPEPFLQGQTDGYTELEVKAFIDSLFAGSGLDSAPIRNMIFHNERIPQEWIKLVAEKTWSCARGKALGMANVLHQNSMRDANVDGVTMVFYAAVLYLSLDGEETLRQYPGFDQVLFDLAHQLIDAFQREKFSTNEMNFILSGFTGSWNSKSFEDLAGKLSNQPLSSGLALVFAQMCGKYAHDPQSARQIIENYVLPYEDQLPYEVSSIAKDALRELQNSESDATL